VKNISWKRIYPHLIAIGVFLIVAVIYCKPMLEGKVLQQTDITQWKAMAHDQEVYKQTHGHASLWSNGMFSGMPGYMITGSSNNELPWIFIDLISLHLPRPIQFFFLASICFYFLSQVLRVNPWVGIAGALAYAYATYNPVIVIVGHETKMITLGLLPGLLASVLLIFDKKYWIGAALTALFTSAMICQKHYQVTYYMFIALLFLGISFLVYWIKRKEYKHLLFAILFTGAGAGLGILSNAVVILPDNEYGKETIRGGTHLSSENGETKVTTGVGTDYAFSYSMYKSEPFVMMVPDMYGGENQPTDDFIEKSKGVEALREMPKEYANELQRYIQVYWGGIGGTSGPPYAGAIICFLTLIGFFILDNKHKWWILGASVLSVVLSWGGYFAGFNTFFLEHVPMYNKFRAPSMILVIPTLLFCVMAVLTLQKIIDTEDKAALWKKYQKGLLLTGIVFIVLLMLYFSFDYRSESEKDLLKQIGNIPDAGQRSAFEQAARNMLNGLKQDRQSLFLGSLLRSLFFIAVAATMIWLSIKKKIQGWIVVAVIGVFAFIDVMAVDLRYLNSDHFQEKEEVDNAFFTPSPADQAILADKSTYRVLNVSQGIHSAFNGGALTSYFHKSIGGYHPVKLSIYQDLIENQLYKFPNCQPVLNMLNTKYIMYGTSRPDQVQKNNDALGPCWFVKTVKYVKGPRAAMDALTTFNPKDTVIVDESFNNLIKPTFTFDSTASIQLVKNDNDIVTYKSKAASEQMAVFSEVYYAEGWNAYIDGKLTPHAKVNYVLRGMMIPAGEHEIVFKFEPTSYATGWKLTSYSSIAILLLLIAAIVLTWKASRPKKM